MKFTLSILLIFSLQTIYAQKSDSKGITIQFNNITKAQLIDKIESNTNYRFYYLKEWLDSKPISGNYLKTTLSEILDKTFENSTVNYYITKDNKVILTNYLLIYDNISTVFTEKESKATNETKAVVKNTKVLTKNPILVIEENGSNTTSYNRTIRIGKETKASLGQTFTLSGYVHNKVTKKPIADLVVSINNKNVVTNRLGFYTFKLTSGSYTLKTKAIGIKDSSRKIILYNNGNLNLNLEEVLELLDEVVITADKAKTLKEVATGITEFKIEEVKNIPLVLGERDLFKVAASLPGIKTAGEGSSGYSVRGGKTDQNLILLDDGVIYNPTHFFGIFSAVNPFTTGSFRVFKGSAPAEYGGRLSSVFDIKTKSGDQDKFKGEASIGPITSNITIETPIKKGKSSLIVGARGTYSNWVLKSLDDTSLDNSSASFYDVIAKYKDVINEKNDIEATGYYSYDDYKITSDSLHSYSNSLISVKWNKEFNEKNSGSLLLANSQYKFDINYEGGGNSDFDLGYKLNETHLKLKMKYTYNEKHKFDYGISSKLYIIDPGTKTPKGSLSIVNPIKVQREKSLESAFFITDNIKVNEKLNLNLGLRYSLYAALGKGERKIYAPDLPKSETTVTEIKNYKNNEVIKTYSGLEFRASARYKVSPSFSLKASYNNTFQYIQSLSNNTTASPTDTWRLSDINIKPQESNQFTVGAYKNFDDDLYEFSVEGYYKNSKNILDYKIGADLLINQSVETEVLQGVGKAYGVEFLIKKTSGKLNGWLGYTYSRSLSKFNGNFSEEKINGGTYFPSNIDKPHDINLVSNYKMTKRFSWSMNFAYQTGRPITYPIGKYTYNGNQYVYYSDHNKFRIPDYYRLDIGLNIEGNHRIKKFAHSFWNISIYNVLGRNNPYSVFFVTKDGKVNAYKSTIFSVPVPTITYNFKF